MDSLDYIKTERTLLRPIRYSDLADYNEYATIEEIGYLSGWRPHSSRLDTLLAIKTIKSAYFHYAIEFQGKMIGTCSLQPDDKRQGLNSYMLGYSLNPYFQKMGLATEVSKALIKKAFSRNVETVSGYCYPENEASKKVLIKCGFEYFKNSNNVINEMALLIF